MSMISSEYGLGPRALRDIKHGCETGRFTITDPYPALLIVGGAALALGQAIHDHPESDDAILADQVTEDILRMFGVPPEDAAAICRSPLPSVVDPLEQALPDLTHMAQPDSP